MQVGVGIEPKNRQSTLCDGKGGNEQLKPTFLEPQKRNAVGSCHENDASVSDYPPFAKSTSLGNLSFINVVGLPCHPRQTSVPSSSTARTKNGAVQPIHHRYASEPHSTLVKAPQMTLPVTIDVANNISFGTTTLMTTAKGTTATEPIWSHCGTSSNESSRYKLNQKEGSEIWNKNSLVVPGRDLRLTSTISTTSNIDFRPGTLPYSDQKQEQQSWVENIPVVPPRLNTTSKITNNIDSIQNTLPPSTKNQVNNWIDNSIIVPSKESRQNTNGTALSHINSQQSLQLTSNQNGSCLAVLPVDPKSPQLNTSDNVSNVNVNFYRAVPMNVMSSVPTIECLNNQSAKNVSNVQIMPLSGSIADRNSGGTSVPCRASITSCQVTVQTEQPPTQVISPSACETVSSVYLSSRVGQRTFTSTEAQTDDSSLGYGELSNNKERRRRERRERRHHRRANPVHSRSVEGSSQNGNSSSIPDILDSHLPPPYSSQPNTLQRSQVVPSLQPPPVRPMPHLGLIPQPVLMPPPQMLGGLVTPQPVAPNIIPHPRPRTSLQHTVSNSGGTHVSYPPPNIIAGQIPLVQNVPENSSGFRFALPVGQFTGDHFSEESPKSCCGVLTWKPGSLKWLIASVALVAVGCVLVGTALGTMRPAGRDHFTIALLMIGIGIVLVTISGVAWRLASQNATSCRTMLGIGSLESVDVCTRRFVPRLPPTYGRPHHPYAAMMYPEFQYRPPPPTYQASMQEYRLRLLLIDRGNTPQIQSGTQNAISPPPTYRSHSGSLIRDNSSTRNDTTWSEYSCPPSYRSQAQLGTIEDSISVHTRDPSLATSDRTIENSVEVVNILRESQEDVNLQESKTEDVNQYKLILGDCGGSFENDKEDNLVTIVQTDERSPVIVTVSGSSSTDNDTSSTKLPSEIQILAHL